MSFLIYDIGLLVIFAIFVAIFLYTRKKNLKKEGLLFLYKTSWGIKLINTVGKKYSKTLQFLSYISIGLGYILMATMLYLFGKLIWIYVFFPQVVQAIKVPPIMPLVPYLPQVFKLDFLPDFYFVYWIAILAVIAITHEFAHGIFAIRNKVKVKTTGFGFFPFFLPVFLAAFVELDEEKMKTKSKFSQMAILSAGTFANVLSGIFFFVIMFAFFSFAFAPAGVVFDDYQYSVIGIEEISMINGITLNPHTVEEISKLINQGELNEVVVNGENYVGIKAFNSDGTQVALYEDMPAINEGVIGAITEVNGINITSIEELSIELQKNSPGNEIVLKTTTGEEDFEYNVILGEHPEDPNFPLLGIQFELQEESGIMSKIVSVLSSFKQPNIYYESKLGEFGSFVYNLLWWLVLICISVALINMLPVGIFDGGRFFYLTILGITGSKKIAKGSFKFVTYLFLFLLLLILYFWVISFF